MTMLPMAPADSNVFRCRHITDGSDLRICGQQIVVVSTEIDLSNQQVENGTVANYFDDELMSRNL